jgi:hypothetical protein
MKLKTILTVLMIVLALGYCSASLTPGGKMVKYVTKQEAPAGCEEIGEVALGAFDKATSVTDAKVRMRNKAAEQGGNFLVIDTFEKTTMYNNNVQTTYYDGSGRSYKCSK